MSLLRYAVTASRPSPLAYARLLPKRSKSPAARRGRMRAARRSAQAARKHSRSAKRCRARARRGSR